MNKHEHRDFWFHDDTELSALLGKKISKRESIREWPISSVQRVTFEDGSNVIYKCQSGGLRESSFYETACSPILLKAQTLWHDSWYSCMVIEHLDTPALGISGKPESELVQISFDLVENIRQIKGDFPVQLDLSTYSKWRDWASRTIQLLRKLINEGHKYGKGKKEIDILEEHVISTSIESDYKGEIGLIHGDPNGGNIFLQENGFKIIDWQTYKYAPVELDRADFLWRQSVDPSRHVTRGITNMLFFIKIWWLTFCQTTLLPNDNFDERITDLIRRISIQQSNPLE